MEDFKHQEKPKAFAHAAENLEKTVADLSAAHDKEPAKESHATHADIEALKAAHHKSAVALAERVGTLEERIKKFNTRSGHRI